MTAFKKNGLSLKNLDYATNYEKVLECGLSQRSEDLEKKRESFYPYLLTSWTNLNRAKLALGEFQKREIELLIFNLESFYFSWKQPSEIGKLR